MARWKGSLTEKFIEEHERFFRWLLALLFLGLTVRIALEWLGLWPWP